MLCPAHAVLAYAIHMPMLECTDGQFGPSTCSAAFRMRCKQACYHAAETKYIFDLAVALYAAYQLYRGHIATSPGARVVEGTGCNAFAKRDHKQVLYC